MKTNELIKALQYELSHNSEILAKVSANNIANGFKDLDIVAPFVVFWLIAESTPTNAGIVSATFQIDIVGTTIENTELISEAIKKLNEYGGTFGNEGKRINHLAVADLGSGFEESESSFLKRLELRIKYQR